MKALANPNPNPYPNPNPNPNPNPSPNPNPNPKALVMDLIHHIDVVDQLMSAGCQPWS